jgi:hypothetical protein
MVHRQPFGRRRGGAINPPCMRAQTAAAATTRHPATEPPPAVADGGWSGHDEELEQWKRARRRHVPWRQISLMASLCFGTASLVLPGAVNETLQWPLYGLAAISFLAGVRRRQAKA